MQEKWDISKKTLLSKLKSRKNRFVGSCYTTDEVNELISVTKGTKLEIPVLFACFYGFCVEVNVLV